MKTLLFIKSLMLIIAVSMNGYSQNNFTVTNQPVDDGFLLIKIEHVSGKYAEYFIEGTEEEHATSFVGDGQIIENPIEATQDYFVKSIRLPEEELSSNPIQFFGADSKIYCFGTNEVIVINNASGEISGTIPLSRSGNFAATAYLNNVPVNKFITGSVANQRIYVADLANNLYFINSITDKIIVSHSYTNFSDQLSTSVAYNENLDLVYWMINSWQGANGSIINVYNGSTGTFLTSRLFNDQINDIIVANDTLFVNIHTDLHKLDPVNLTTKETYAGSFDGYNEKLFVLNQNELAFVSYHYNSPDSRTLTIINPNTLIPSQVIAPSNGSILINDLKVEGLNNSFILLALGDGGYTDVYRYMKNQNGLYVETNNTYLSSSFSKSLSQISSGSNIYCGGRDYLFSLNLQTFTINYWDNIKGCYSYDLLLTTNDTTTYVYSANPIEGTISRHNADCTIDGITQTAFKVNSGCFNVAENKMYFVNSRLNYTESGLAIVDAANDQLISIIPLGKQLTDAVYNESVNRVFVSGKGDSKLFVVSGSNDNLIHTLTLPTPPTHLISVGNKIYCGSNTAIYVVDASSYNYSTLNLSFPDQEEKCRDIIYVEDAGRIYALYAHGNNSYVAVINISNSSIEQIYELSLVRKAEVIRYNPIDQNIYIANSKIPRLYVYDPVDFTEVNVISYVGQAVFHDLDMNIDHYRNKAYLTYFNVASAKNFVSVIDLATSSSITSELYTPKSAQAFNPVNDQLYYYKTSIDQDNKSLVYSGILDCMDDTNLPDVGLENIINRPYIFIGESEKLKPVINSLTNKIYMPNSSFSNISVIQAYYDILPLQNGWNWKSFPRIERYGNDYHQASKVLEQINYFPIEIFMYYKFIQQDWIAYNDILGWHGLLQEVRSTEGYKLYFDLTEGPAPEILLLGARLHPDTIIALSPSTDNWIGYFIQEPQWPWDAFPPDVYDNDLTSIQTQYWTMVKMFGAWQIPKIVTPLKYGDLIIVTIQGQAPVRFAWNNPAVGEEEMEGFKTSYYTFEEQSGYLPVFIEKDPLDDFVEIAVLANGEVRGASVVFENDSLVQVCAYLQGVPPGTPLEFETWSGTKSSRVDAGNYLVRNRKTGIFEHRIAYAGENTPFQYISFKSGQENNKPDPDQFNLSVYPNPLLNNTVFAFSIHQEADVRLNIFDMYGKCISNPVSGRFSPGSYRIAWDASDDAGQSLSGGVYFYRLTTSNGKEISGKIIIIR